MWPLATVQIPHTLQYLIENKQTDRQKTNDQKKPTKTQFSWLLAHMERAPKQQEQAIALEYIS